MVVSGNPTKSERPRLKIVRLKSKSMVVWLFETKVESLYKFERLIVSEIIGADQEVSQVVYFFLQEQIRIVKSNKIKNCLFTPLVTSYYNFKYEYKNIIWLNLLYFFDQSDKITKEILMTFD